MFATDGVPPEFMLAERFGWTLEYIAGLPNRTFFDLVAYVRVVNEAARNAAKGR